MSYYKKFRIVIGTPFWKIYLRWAYKTCIEDLNKLNFISNFNKDNFLALLCGVGNETTADEFIKFVLNKNKKAKIIIIDLGNEQIAAANQLVKEKYSNFDIKIKRINALELDSFVKKNTINWIETDGFLEYFDKKSLLKLLLLWHSLLRQDGFVTLREPASHGLFGHFIDKFRVWVGKAWLNITLYEHTMRDLTLLFNKTGFRFTLENTILPTFKRFSLIKK